MVRIQPAPGVRNRDHWDRRKGLEDHLVLRQVESAMERGDEWCRLTGKQGKRIVIEMKVQQIEIMSPLANSLEHGDMQRIRVVDRAVKTQCLRPTCLQVGEVCESPLANKTTSCPSATSSSANHEITRS